MKKRLAFCVAAFALFASVACAAVNEAGLAKLEEVLNKYTPNQFVEFSFGSVGMMKTKDDKEIPALAFGVKYNTDFFLKTFAPEIKAAMDGVFPTAPVKYRYKDEPPHSRLLCRPRIQGHLRLQARQLYADRRQILGAGLFAHARGLEHRRGAQGQQPV